MITQYQTVRAMALEYGDIVDESLNIQFWLMMANSVKIYVRLSKSGYWANLCGEDAAPKPFIGSIHELRHFIRHKAGKPLKEPVIDLDKVDF